MKDEIYCVVYHLPTQMNASFKILNRTTLTRDTQRYKSSKKSHRNSARGILASASIKICLVESLSPKFNQRKVKSAKKWAKTYSAELSMPRTNFAWRTWNPQHVAPCVDLHIEFSWWRAEFHFCQVHPSDSMQEQKMKKKFQVFIPLTIQSYQETKIEEWLKEKMNTKKPQNH